MGHGAFDHEHGGVLLFTDRAGHSLPVTAGDLGVLLRDHTSMSLAVLNACEAGRTDPADPFAGVADTLVRRGIPAVVAMQFEVSDDAAIEFAPALYGALAAGRAVDAAVAEAEAALREAIRLDPVLAAPHATLGGVLLGLKRFTEAEAACLEAVRLDPAVAVAYANLGSTLDRLNRPKEAETACREAIRLDPALASAHFHLSSALLALGQNQEAETAYREAIRLDPVYGNARYKLFRTGSRLQVWSRKNIPQ